MDRDDEIAKALWEWQERRDRGEPVTPDDVVAANPDLAPELESQFAFLGALESASEPLPPGAPREIGDFRIVREIGRGGMGVVYEAEQVSMARRVALKVLSLAIAGTPHAVRRFEREARAAGRLHHTNIVPIHAMGQHAGHWYYAMELVQGMPLSRVVVELRAAGGHPREESLARMTPGAVSAPGTGTGARSYFVRVAEMFAAVAEALDLAHREGIVHRDIKPGNLLLDTEGVLKVVDFGLAIQNDEAGPALTMTGDLLGTPAYMSPEQAMAKRIRIDHRTDVYSLGATLYEALTLRPPFEGKNLYELCSQIVTKDPALPRRVNAKVPRDLETIVLKAMEKDRDKRYQNAGAFARDLRRFAQGFAVEARRIGVGTRAWRKVKRHKVRSLLVAAVVLLAGTGALLGARAAEEAARRLTLDYARLCAQAEQATIASLSSSRSAPASVQGRVEFFGSFGDSMGAIPAVTTEGAAALFSEAIALAPDRPEAYVGRALAPERTLEERFADIDAARARGLSARTWHLARAHLHECGGRAADAGGERTRAAAESGDAPLDLYLEACLCVAQSRWEEARETLGRLLALGDAAPTVRCLGLWLRAAAHRREGQHSLALEDLIKLQALGDDSAVLKARVASAWRPIDLRVAEQRFEEAMEQVGREGTEDAWCTLCGTARHGDDHAWSERAARKGLETHPLSARLHSELGAALNCLKRTEEALPLLDRAVELDPRLSSAHNRRGCALLDLCRSAEALAAFDRAIDVDPRSVGAHGNRGKALADLGRLEEALAAYDRAIEIDPRHAGAHYNRGNALNKLGRVEEALAAFDRAIEIDPRNATAHCNRGSALNELGRVEEALAAYDRATEIDPRIATCHYNRGYSLNRLGRLKEALAAFDRAIEFDPRIDEAHCNRGVVLKKLGRFEEALAAQDRAIEIDPRMAAAHYNRGYALNKLGRLKEALAAFDRAIEIDPRNAGAHSWRGILLCALDRLEDARAAYARAAELAPLDASTLNSLAWFLATCPEERLRDPARAVEVARKALVAEPGAGTVWITLAIALLRAGKPLECLEALDRSMGLREGGNALDWYFAAMAHARLGNPEKARAFYECALAWTKEHAPDDPELRRFGEEAAALIATAAGSHG